MTPFSPKSLDFLFENRLRDSREWFQAHKEDFQKLVLTPLQELTVALTPCMLEIDRHFTTEPRVDRTISRVRRDTRFSRDKSLYRDNMWIIFKRGKMHGTELPGVYFEISGEGFGYGCGYYSASTGYMNTLRQLVLSGDPVFKKAQRALASQQIFQLEGETYKRPHYPDQPDALRSWLERRNISLSAESKDFELLFSDRLADKLIADFKLLAPIYDFLLHTAQAQMKESVIRPVAERIEP